MSSPAGIAIRTALPQSDDDAGCYMIATLLPIFARVLRRPAIDPGDDFFDLGGDSILAVRLMVEIETATGHALPLTAIFDAPTVAAMSKLILNEYHAARSCLILLKPGIGKPLYIAHGLGGSVIELRAVAQAIDTGAPVYGVEARGLDGLDAPFDRVEDMAAFYLESIRRLQPEGPYFIAGFSFGGLVALEMARTLLGTGHEVALLALLDTFPHTRFWPLRARLDSWRRLARISISAPTLRRLFRYHRDVLHAKPLAQKFTYVAGRGWRAAKIAANIFRLGAWLRRFADLSDDKVVPAGPELPAAIQRVQRAGDCAYARYRPGRYPGEIAFIKAASEHSVPFLAEALWGRLAARLNVVAVPGDHQNLVRANAAFLARELTELLRRADFTPVR